MGIIAFMEEFRKTFAYLKMIYLLFMPGNERKRSVVVHEHTKPQISQITQIDNYKN